MSRRRRPWRRWVAATETQVTPPMGPARASRHREVESEGPGHADDHPLLDGDAEPGQVDEVPRPLHVLGRIGETEGAPSARNMAGTSPSSGTRSSIDTVSQSGPRPAAPRSD